MIPFPIIENRFSLFVADHLLVNQLCTNPKSDRSLLSCLKVTQCSTSEIGDAPLYNSCPLPIQVMTTGPLPEPSKCKSGLPRITGRCQGDENKVSGYGYGLWWGFKWGPHHATSHLRSRLESQHQSVPGCTDSVVILWCNEVVGGRPSAPAHKSKETQAWLCTLLSLAPLLPRPESAGLLRLVIRREHHQHDLPQRQSQPDHRHPPSIRRAPAGACGKGMLPVPDQYRGSDWGWRPLHWIDVSSTP